MDRKHWRKSAQYRSIRSIIICHILLICLIQETGMIVHPRQTHHHWVSPQTLLRPIFLSVHGPADRAPKERGLSHGLKTCHRHVFTAALLPPPFQVSSHIPKNKGDPTGCPLFFGGQGGKQMSTGHLHLDGFKSLFPAQKKRHTNVCLFSLVGEAGLEPARPQ